jgi:hypothetical protein
MPLQFWCGWGGCAISVIVFITVVNVVSALPAAFHGTGPGLVYFFALHPVVGHPVCPEGLAV